MSRSAEAVALQVTGAGCHRWIPGSVNIGERVVPAKNALKDPHVKSVAVANELQQEI